MIMQLNVKVAIFQWQHGQYVVEETESDFLVFLDKYPNSKRATPVNFDDTAENFYLVFVQDCFDPPVAIIRAQCEVDAEELFVDNLTWAHIDQEDIDPNNEDTLFNSNGQPYDSELIAVHQVNLTKVEL